MTIAVVAPRNGGNGYESAHEIMFVCSSATKILNQPGGTTVGVASGDRFGHSVSISFDGVTVSSSTLNINDNGVDSGHEIVVHSSTAKKWNQVGDALVGAVSCDRFGCSISMSSEGMIVAAGAPYEDDDGCDSGHARLFTYSSTENTSNRIDDTLVRSGSSCGSGWSVSISTHSKTVAVGDPRHYDSGHSMLF